MFETVLFPIDQSRQTMETAAVALHLARQHGSRMVLLSVVEAEEGVSMTPPPSASFSTRPAPASSRPAWPAR